MSWPCALGGVGKLHIINFICFHIIFFALIYFLKFSVVVGEYEVQVYDQLIMNGNTAVLKCAIPAYVKDYVTVTSWLHNDVFNIYPSTHGGLYINIFNYQTKTGFL